MKNVTLIIIAIALFFGIEGVANMAVAQQQDTVSKQYQPHKFDYVYDGLINSCKYIFAGTKISEEPFLQKNTGETHLSKKIKITAIYRNPDGKLKLGTVQVILYPSPVAVDTNGTILGPIEYSEGGGAAPDDGIYFCRDSTTTKDYHKIPTDNEPLLLEQQLGFSFQEVYHDPYERTPVYHGFKGFGRGYMHKEDFFMDLNLYPNMIIPDSLLQKKSPNENEVKPTGNIQEFNHDALSNAFINGVKVKSDNPKSNRHSKHIASDDITFGLANAVKTGSGPYFLEFDITIEGSPSNSDVTYFDNAIFDISYNQGAFGAYVTDSSSFVVYEDPDYTDPSYVINYISSISSNVFEVQFGQFASTFNRTQDQTSAVNMLHFKMQIWNCSEDVNVNFDNLGAQPYYELAYDADPSVDSPIPYDGTSYSGSISQTFCIPKITSFTASVPGGTNFIGGPNLSAMTILGDNFGDIQGIGNVFFSDADTGGLGPLYPLNSYDIQNWSEHQIDLTLPGFIDSLPIGKVIPGGGTFRVKTNTNDTVSNTTPFSVPYSILNHQVGVVGNYKKVREDLGDLNGAGGITFHLDVSIVNYTNPMLAPLVIKAIKTWACMINVNFIVGATDTFGISPATDNIIRLTNAPIPLAHTALAQTSITPQTCVDLSNNNPYWVAHQITIVILNSPALVQAGTSWFLDTLYNGTPDNLPIKQYDLFAVILHELGHACMLNHVTTNNDLMYWSPQINYFTFIPDWQRRIISSDDQDGGLNVVAKSAINPPLSCSISDMIPVHLNNCIELGGIPNLNPNVTSFVMFPNPLNDNLLNITYNLKQSSPINLEVLDITGREVYSMNENSSAGEHTDQLNLDNLSIGVYLIKIIIGDTQDTQKLVKIR